VTAAAVGGLLQSVTDCFEGVGAGGRLARLLGRRRCRGGVTGGHLAASAASEASAGAGFTAGVTVLAAADFVDVIAAVGAAAAVAGAMLAMVTRLGKIPQLLDEIPHL
jgi:hypothetical protein